MSILNLCTCFKFLNFSYHCFHWWLIILVLQIWLDSLGAGSVFFVSLTCFPALASAIVSTLDVSSVWRGLYFRMGSEMFLQFMPIGIKVWSVCTYILELSNKKKTTESRILKYSYMTHAIENFICDLNDGASDDAVSCFNFWINEDAKVLGGGFISRYL